MNLNLLAVDYVTLLNQITSSREYYIFSTLLEIAIWVLGHVFLSIAIYTFAKKNGYKKLWVSFIPFFNLILLGKVIGKTVVWGKAINNIGFWACITGLVATIVNFLIDFGYYVSLFEVIFNCEVSFTSAFINAWVNGESLAWVILYYGSGLFDIAYIFFEVSLIFMVFRLYCPEKSFVYALLSIFIDPPMFGILLFICRNKPKHVIIRAQPPRSNFYGGYYGGYYGNAQRPQNFNNAEESKQKAEDPFPEFADAEPKDDNSDGEGFFN